MIPKKLKRGDEIRVVAPSRSMAIISKEVIKIAEKRFQNLGLTISFAKNVNEKDEFVSSSIKTRVDDLHQAFLDKKVKAIFTAIGGFNSNQLLKYLNYDLIKKNPKILCGYSDITALSNAIYAKTGLVTYSGPHFSTFGMIKGLDCTLKYLEKCLINEESFEVLASKNWSDDQWYLDQNKRKFVKNDGFLKINKGKAEGTIIGGNLGTFHLLAGTKYFPSLKNTVLFLEDDEGAKEYSAVEFDRHLQAILQLPDSNKIKGIVIGRFQKTSMIDDKQIIAIIKTKKELKNIPVIANVDFGHTTPQITFPIGGIAKLNVTDNKIELKIVKH